MSKVAELKSAALDLSPQERLQFARWLAEAEDVQHLQVEDLRREIAIGIAQAERGQIAPLDIESVKTEVHRCLQKKPQD